MQPSEPMYDLAVIGGRMGGLATAALPWRLGLPCPGDISRKNNDPPQG